LSGIPLYNYSFELNLPEELSTNITSNENILKFLQERSLSKAKENILSDEDICVQIVKEDCYSVLMSMAVSLLASSLLLLWRLQRSLTKRTHLQAGLNQERREKTDLQAGLDQEWREKTDLQAELNQERREKTDIKADLDQEWREKSDLQADLDQERREKSDLQAG
jgi:septal ring factor EnvC (AmiA/AmiB activator)